MESINSSNAKTKLKDLHPSQRILNQYENSETSLRGERESKPYLKGKGRKSEITFRIIRRKHKEVFRALLLLSQKRACYLGYYGFGATKHWRYMGLKIGTMAVLDNVKVELSELEHKILESMALSGSLFCKFDDLMEDLAEANVLPLVDITSTTQQ